MKKLILTALAALAIGAGSLHAREFYTHPHEARLSGILYFAFGRDRLVLKLNKPFVVDSEMHSNLGQVGTITVDEVDVNAPGVTADYKHVIGKHVIIEGSVTAHDTRHVTAENIGYSELTGVSISPYHWTIEGDAK